MIHGIDTSIYQGKWDVNSLPKDIQFVIIKATESRMTDSVFITQQDELRKKNIKLGYYHFARFSGGKGRGIEQADYFLDRVGIRPGEFLCLDLEAESADCRYIDESMAFLKRIEEKLGGYKPFIYMNLSTARKKCMKVIADNNNGLWLAYYNKNDGSYNNPPDAGVWQVVAMEQYTSVGKVDNIKGSVDRDVFYGSIEQLDKYCYYPKPVVKPEPVIDNCTELKLKVEALEKENDQIEILNDHINSLVTENKQLKSRTADYDELFKELESLEKRLKEADDNSLMESIKSYFPSSEDPRHTILKDFMMRNVQNELASRDNNEIELGRQISVLVGEVDSKDKVIEGLNREVKMNNTAIGGLEGTLQYGALPQMVGNFVTAILLSQNLVEPSIASTFGALIGTGVNAILASIIPTMKNYFNK